MRATVAMCVALCGLPLASCVDGGSVPAGPTVAVNVAPLTLPAITDAAWRITVENGQGETVFTRDLDSRGYGAGDGSLAYVGPCDADQNDNTVTLELLSLYEGAGGAVLIDPASYHDPGPIARGFTCLHDADVAVDFDITVAHSASQGFFDVAVSFDDIFCSAKLDCLDEQDQPLRLLHDADGVRGTTVVVAFACTQGGAGTTVLFHDDVVLDCGGAGAATVDPGAGPGNLVEGAGISDGDGLLFGAAVHRGGEQFTVDKGYWNVLLGLEDAVPSCVLTTRATAVAGPLVGLTTPDGATYPYVAWSVPLTNATGDLSCTRHPLDGVAPNDGVATVYHTSSAPLAFGHAFAVASGAVLNDRCPTDPAKTAPGACGCGIADTDSDGDGAADCVDDCPTDPAKTAPGACGCGTADTDSDGDGAANCVDGCPTDPAKTAPGVCGCGTADTDSDGDGAANCVDDCPTDPAKTAPGVCGCGVAEDCNSSVDVAATGEGHSNLVRIDSTSFAVAYTDNPDRTVAPTSFKVRIGQLVNGTFTLGAPVSFSANLCSPGADKAIQLMGAIGAPYFIVHTQGADYTDAFHLMKQVGSSVQRVYTYNWPTATNAFRWSGHPLDGTRYIFRYREGNSGNPPVQYRVFIRSGETLSVSSAFTRPTPSSFPSLSASEPKVPSPLVRTGANTFREIRSGYVWDPGYLSSWTLTVSASNTMSASNIQTHTNSATRTMESLVVGTGAGPAVVIYDSYGAGWYYGYFTSGTAGFTNRGTIHPGGESYSGQSGDSTDGYYGGKYFIRGRDGTLYRFDTLSSTPTVVQTGLPWVYCRAAPHLARVGGYGVFLVCGAGSLRIHYVALQ